MIVLKLKELLRELPLDADQRRSISGEIAKMDEAEAWALQNQIAVALQSLVSIVSEVHNFLAENEVEEDGDYQIQEKKEKEELIEF